MREGVNEMMWVHPGLALTFTSLKVYNLKVCSWMEGTSCTEDSALSMEDLPGWFRNKPEDSCAWRRAASAGGSKTEDGTGLGPKDKLYSA